MIIIRFDEQHPDESFLRPEVELNQCYFSFCCNRNRNHRVCRKWNTLPKTTRFHWQTRMCQCLKWNTNEKLSDH